jgi:hypothetical protein
MASLAARHPRHQEPRLFEGPVLFKGARGGLAELIALVWLAAEVVQFVRERVEAAGAGREHTQSKEGFGWKR